MIGASNEQFIIRKKIGEGGMGTVYLAEDILLERPVAIKVLKKSDSSNTESPDSRFQQEALALARLNHPNITHLYAFIPKGDSYWMVMEYVEGKTLEDWLAIHKSLNVETACSILVQILDGLDHAHRKGIIHRDLKPANVMISAEGEVKIMDFGIARIKSSQRLTQSGKSVGTLEYMAPEQIQGKEGDELTDIYAAGNILYELLSGQTPFKADTDYHLMKSKLEEKAPHHPILVSKVSARLQEVIFKSLERNPSKRYSSVLFFKEAIIKNSESSIFTSYSLITALQNNQATDLILPEKKEYPFRFLKFLPAVPRLPFQFPDTSEIKKYFRNWKSEKSVLLLIAVVVLCSALIIWNVFSTQESTGTEENNNTSTGVNYSVSDYTEDLQPQKKQIDLIENQLIDNHRSILPMEAEAPKEKTIPPDKKEPISPRENRKKETPPANKEEKKSDQKESTPSAPQEQTSAVNTRSDEVSAGSEPKKPVSRINIPEGRRITVTLDEDISSEIKSKDGGPVALHCTEDIKVNETIIIKKGAMAIGKIVDVEPSGKRKKALVGFVVQKIKAADGKVIRVRSERFRLKAANPDEPAIFKSGTSFSVSLVKGTVF